MLGKIILIAVIPLGVIIFFLAPDALGVIGSSITILTWLFGLLFPIPHQSVLTRGWWMLSACLVLFTTVISAATLIYLQANSIPLITVTLVDLTLQLSPRVFSFFAGAIIGTVLTLIFFVAVGFFSSIYVLAMPADEDISFWNAFRSFISLVLGLQYKFLLIKDGQIIDISEKGFLEGIFSVGKIVVTPGNAVVLQKGGKITRIVGPGVVITNKSERIREVFDLRPQFSIQNVQNVITADRIPLKIELGIGYKLTPAENPDTPAVLKEKNFGVFPVEKETIHRAAFNNTAGKWTGFSQGAPVGQLRDQIMAHCFDEIFEIDGTHKNITIRVNKRQVKLIEDAIKGAVNGFAGNFGVEITGIDIREIILPDDIRKAVHIQIKSQAEAEAIKKIEAERNTARGELVTKILKSISTGTGNQIGTIELKLATVFAQISRRALTDDVLGHQYIEMLI